MNLEIRPATADEMGELGILGGYVYGGEFGDGPENVIATENKPEWTLCAFIDGKLASSFSNVPFTMRANGNAVQLAGVSSIGTLPEYRRRGLVRRIHTRAFGEMREAGQNVAALWASQAAIYQRYGYAMVTVMRHYAVDTENVRFYDLEAGSGRVARVDLGDAYDIVDRIYVEFVADGMCNLHREKEDWQQYVRPVSAAGPVWVAVCYDADNAPQAYVVYTLRAGMVNHATRDQELVIRDLAWLKPDAYRSLWRFIASHDLVGRVRWRRAPADDPAAEYFLEPRLLNAENHEGAWLRIIDAPRALGERGYDLEADLTIRLADDPLTPWNDGTWRLETGPDGARAEASRKTPDIQLASKALASLYAGARSATELANWGLLEGDRHAIANADAIFRTRHAPHLPDHF